MAKQQAGLVDPRLAKALSHPMRGRILAILNAVSYTHLTLPTILRV